VTRTAYAVTYSIQGKITSANRTGWALQHSDTTRLEKILPNHTLKYRPGGRRDISRSWQK
jgi:hypothetical protein